MVLESLGKTSTSVAVIMREQDAVTDPQQQIKEAIGSGPFKFAKDEWVPGSKTVYLKNADYVTRPSNEKAASFAGSKFPGVDRIELVWISDPQTAMSALINGEIDFYENPNIDFFPILEKARGVKLMKTGKLDSDARLHPAQSPAPAVQQREGAPGHVLPDQPGGLPARDRRRSETTTASATASSPAARRSPATPAAHWLKEYNPKKALQLLKEAGYNGEPITVLAATDHNTITPATQVLIQAMREAGINLDVQSMDWGSVVSRRAKREPPAQGGWNIFVTTTGTVAAATRCCTPGSAPPATRALFGWPCDAEIEKLRNAYGFAQTDAEKKPRSPATCRRAPWSRWSTSRSASGTRLYAYRADRIDGIVPNTGLVVLWNITKK